MPHIHTEPDQHDITTSAWIFRHEDGELKVFVHMHRKIQKYMEVGGHIELDETPWQTIAHELEEESGYTLTELKLYQPKYMPVDFLEGVAHPTPMFFTTYQPQIGHYHTDLCYAFYAKDVPKKIPHENESQDVRWFTLAELEAGAAAGVVLSDIVHTYKEMAKVIVLPYIHLVKTEAFSLEKPNVNDQALEKRPVDSVLTITRFGNPVLRQKAKKLTEEMIASDEIQAFIGAMYAKLASDEYGVGLAAPQVGKSLALSVIGIKPTPTRPDMKKFNTVVINPSYEGIGEKDEKWEGCISCGTGDDTLYAKVPRYSKIQATWLDETAVKHEKTLDGFVAHVFQHETDHLNGVLFVDRVKDASTFMMGDEYRRRVARQRKAS